MKQVFTNLTTGGPISVYVEDGKVTQIRPLQVPEEDYPTPWVVEDRNGKKYSPPKAMRLAQNILTERNRLYSEDRILYPMKRVDWDPNGERNPQNRGKSGYERISWDEATTIIANELFYNVPARKKFMKSDTTETSEITEIVSKLALAHPEIAFKLISNGKAILHTAGDELLKNAIYYVYGKELTKEIVEVENVENEICYWR